MKVILKNTGQVQDVSEGYARNFLLPKGLAVIATETELKKIEERKKSEIEEEGLKREESLLTVKKLDGKLITVKKKPTNKKISEAIASQLGFRIDKHNIIINDEENQAEIDFGRGVKCQINLKISS